MKEKKIPQTTLVSKKKKMIYLRRLYPKENTMDPI